MPSIRSRAARIALAASFVALSVAAVATVSSASSTAPADRWLKGLTGKHRQFFDAPAAGGGVPLVHVMNYYDTYNKAYGVKDADIEAVFTFYGGTTFYGLSDAAWAKYRIGEFLETNDASGKPATANPWRTAPVVAGMTIPGASIEALQKRGATFILCDNALTFMAGMLAAKRGLDAGAVYADLRAQTLPGVEVVPGMVVAVEQAQRAGMAYHRQ
jgi:intracellular sulfur oxidation DsrE/DsrF family protein